MRVTVDDVRKAGYCTKGLRLWMNRANIDITDFVTNGIDAEKLADVNDSRLDRVLAITRTREAKNDH